MTTITISGVIGWDVEPKDIRNQLNEASGDIVVEIGSPGGFVYDGLEIFNLIRGYSKGKVTTRLMGLAASMASYIALAGQEVEAYDNAIYMIHNAMSVSVGNQNDMREMADYLERLSNLLAKKYVEKTGKSLAEIKELMDADTFMFGSEAKEMGFVDKIIETENEKDKDSAMVEAQLKIKNCKQTLKELENSKEDLQKAAALLQPKNDLTSATPEINNNKKQKEETNNMKTLDELLAENSGAKKEYEGRIAEATEKGSKEIKNRIENAKNFLANKEYPTLGSLAVDVITGKVDSSALTASVAAIDAVKEKANSENANKETNENGDTPAEAPKGTNKSGVCETEEDFQAELERFKKVNGGN